MTRPRPSPGARNLWAVSLTSLLTDASTEMVSNVLPLFLANVLGVRTGVVGLVEGAAESIASLLRVFSGSISDRLARRKWLAVGGYALSTLVKPFYALATTWGLVAGVRWADRFGKGVRGAPRDALIADSVASGRRGLAFGIHRAADTLGAVLGLAVSLLVVARLQGGAAGLSQDTFRTLVLVSLVPAVLAVAILALVARDVPREPGTARPPIGVRQLGRPFLIFLLISGLFDLGNSSDAFLLLRAQERGLGVTAILGMLIAFNLAYALLSAPAGWLSDRIGRRRVLLAGWLLYALVYLGFGLAQRPWQAWLLFAVYGLYYALSYGTARAMIADLVPEALRGTAYGAYGTVLGVIDLPASLLAGVLWQGVGAWNGFGPAAPFLFGAALACLAAVALALWTPGPPNRD